jgi:hypothetical protein
LARVPRSGGWIAAGLVLGFLLAPAIVSRVDGIGMPRLLADYRALLIYPLLIAYLLVTGHLVQKTRVSVARALRPLVQLDEGAFGEVVARSSRVNPRGEWAALAVGLGVGLAINVVFEPVEPEPYFLERYAYLARIIVWGFVAWAVYAAFAVTRLTNTLLRQPLRVDIFDLRPFQPIGRQSLWLSLMFVGGMVLGLLSSNFTEAELRLEYLISNAFVVALIVAVFFVNTHGVHRVLAAAKRQRLATVERNLAGAYYRLEALIAERQDTHATATELSALALSKQELRSIRTWPYNTEMLRTLFISVVTPLLVALARVTADLLDIGRFAAR